DVFVQPGDTALFFNSPYLSRLTRLRVHQFRQGADVARALAQSPSLTGLTALDLDEGNVGDEGTAILAGSPNLSRLQVLPSPGSGLLQARDQLLGVGMVELFQNFGGQFRASEAEPGTT